MTEFNKFDTTSMSDFFGGTCSVPVDSDDELVVVKYGGKTVHVAEFSSRGQALAAAHAINSHDRMMAEVTELRNVELGCNDLERLKIACTKLGISTPESMEEFGLNQKKYVKMLIEGVIDNKFINLANDPLLLVL